MPNSNTLEFNRLDKQIQMAWHSFLKTFQMRGFAASDTNIATSHMWIHPFGFWELWLGWKIKSVAPDQMKMKIITLCTPTTYFSSNFVRVKTFPFKFRDWIHGGNSRSLVVYLSVSVKDHYDWLQTSCSLFWMRCALLTVSTVLQVWLLALCLLLKYQ